MWNKPTEAKPAGKASNAPASPANSSPVISQPASSAPSSDTTSQAPTYALTTSSAPSIRASANAANADSLFGAGITVHGEISGTSDLYIEGNAQGKIRLPGSKITVGPRGKVQSDIEAREIIIEGTVQGNLKADESVLLGASSRVQGGVLSPRITIADGASFRGKVEMTRGAKTAPQSESETSKENVTRVPLASRAKEA